MKTSELIAKHREDLNKRNEMMTNDEIKQAAINFGKNSEYSCSSPMCERYIDDEILSMSFLAGVKFATDKYEAKNAELENQLKLSNEFVDIWRDKAIELEKKLEAVEMVHSNYVNVSCDLYSTLEKKLEIARGWMESRYDSLELSRNYSLSKFKTDEQVKIKEALAAINMEGV